MSKKIAVVLTDYFEDSEYTEPAKAFKDAGHQLTVIEKEKGKTLKGKQGEAQVETDASIDEVSPADFDALLIPGGFSPDILRADQRFVSFAKSFMDDKKTGVCDLPRPAAFNHRQGSGRSRCDRLHIDSSRFGKRRGQI